MFRVIELLSEAISSGIVPKNHLAKQLDKDPAFISRLCHHHMNEISLEDAICLARLLGLNPVTIMATYFEDKLRHDPARATTWRSLKRTILGFAGHLGLELNLIVQGDRRDVDRPKSQADLLANAPSTIDLHFLGRLGTPPAIITDQIMFDEGKPFSESDWLSIASPKVNLCTRECNSAACFRFNHAAALLEEYETLKTTLRTQSNWRDKNVLGRLESMRKAFSGAGVIGPFGSPLDSGQQYLYGIITLASHPWNRERVVVLAAGMRGLATAAAVAKLGDQQLFLKRPFGGIFSIPDGPWLNGLKQVENASDRFEWVTEEYTSEQYAHAAGKHLQFREWWSRDGRRLVDLIQKRRENAEAL